MDPLNGLDLLAAVALVVAVVWWGDVKRHAKTREDE